MAAVGVISGTSMDAVDVALVTTDGEGTITRGPSLARPYAPEDRAIVAAALKEAMAAPVASHRTPGLAAAEEVVTRVHGDAIAAFLDATGVAPDVIGWHGQTVAHAPERGFTMQLGNGAALAARFGVPVVFDLRQADVAAADHRQPPES